MAVLLLVMAGITIGTLLSTRADVNRLADTINASDAYDRTALGAAMSAVYSGNFIRSGDPADLRAFQETLQKTFQYEALAKDLGTEEERRYLNELEEKYALEMLQAVQSLSAFANGEAAASQWNDPGKLLADVTTALTVPANAKREAALEDLDSFEGALASRSLLVIAVFALGLPLVVASYVVTRRWERKDAVRDAQLAILREAALTDSLTGLRNLRAFQEDLRQETARSARNQEPITVAVLDVDNFKEINDAEGHLRGDQVLAELGRIMTGSRDHHKAYRIGGDEFALIMPGTGDADALAALERLRKAITAAVPGVSVSIGYTSAQGDYLTGPWRDRADTALYEAKRLGKDRIVKWEAGLGKAEAA